MIYEIIEDCSPYYIRFTYTGIEKMINACSTNTFDYQKILNDRGNKFAHHRLLPENGKKLLELCPMTDILSINENRVSLFVTEPGYIYRAHKDGLNIRCGINYNVHVLDDKCVTSWYSDNDMKDYAIDTLGGRSREAIGFNKEFHNPVKSMVAKQGECVLFNTEMFHDWDNRESSNIRAILTLRFNDPSTFYFEDARKLMFGY